MSMSDKLNRFSEVGVGCCQFLVHKSDTFCKKDAQLTCSLFP